MTTNEKPITLDDHRFHSILLEFRLASKRVLEILKAFEKVFANEMLNKKEKISSKHGVCREMRIMCVQRSSDRIETLFPAMEKSCKESDDPALADSHLILIINPIKPGGPNKPP